MKNKLIISLITILLLGNISAVSFSTIDNFGLSFTDPLITQQVTTALCTFTPPLLEPSCITQFVGGKVVDKISEIDIQKISILNQDAANSIKTFNKVKDTLNKGNKVGTSLGLDKDGNITQGNLVFGYSGAYVGTLLGLSKDEEVFAKNVKIDFNRGKKYNQITFLLDNYFELYQRGEKTVFENIQAYTQKTNASLKLNLSRNITEVDFTTLYTTGSTYTIDNDRIYVPANSRIVFKNGKTDIFISDNADLKEVPKLVNSGLFGNEIEVKGNNIKLPGKDVILDRGIITYKNGVPFVNVGDEAVINGFKISPVSSDVELKLSSKGFIRSAGEYFGVTDKESGNFVRLADKVEANGEKFSLRFDPKSFVEGSESSYIHYMDSLSFSNSNNRKYFSLGDKGEDVTLIQKLVGVKKDGIYGKETQNAVKIWQKENGIKADGLFGTESLKTAIGFDNTKNIVVSPNGGRVLISGDDGRLKMDFTGDHKFKIGSETFFTNKITENSYLKDLSLLRSNNKKAFSLGDEGKDVKLIQKLVGLEQTGEFDETTKRAVTAWQKENNILADGKFGPKSLQTAFTDQTEIYRDLKEHINNNAEVPIDLILRNSDGSVNKKLVLQEPITSPSEEVISSIENIRIEEDNKINIPIKKGNYIYLDRSTQRGYYIEDGKVVQDFLVGVGTGNDPRSPDEALITPKGEFTVNSVEYNKPVGKWAKDIPFGLLKKDEGYDAGIRGKLLSVYGPGFIALQDSKGRVIQEGIHGTSCLGMAQLLFTPSGKRYVSHGCVRMLNDDWRDLISKIKPGTKVIIG